MHSKNRHKATLGTHSVGVRAGAVPWTGVPDKILGSPKGLQENHLIKWRTQIVVVMYQTPSKKLAFTNKQARELASKHRASEQTNVREGG